jgi:hypothetical protein
MPRHLGTISATTEHWQASTVGLLKSMHYFNGGCRRRKDMLRNRCIIYQPRRFLFQGVFITSFLAAAGRFFFRNRCIFLEPRRFILQGVFTTSPLAAAGGKNVFLRMGGAGSGKVTHGHGIHVVARAFSTVGLGEQTKARLESGTGDFAISITVQGTIEMSNMMSKSSPWEHGKNYVGWPWGLTPMIMDTLGFEPRAFRMRSGCDTTTPCAP